jgi:hypothetical protein
MKLTMPRGDTPGHRNRVAATAWRMSSEERAGDSFRKKEQTQEPGQRCVT